MSLLTSLRKRLLLIGTLLVFALGAALLGVSVTHESPSAAAATVATPEHDHGDGKPPTIKTAAQLAFHDQMRKLWEDHVTWTRLAIVTFAAGTQGFDTTAARLLQNQVDIANAFKPFYGDATAARLASLLHDHITIAVEILQAAKAGDTNAVNEASARWYANANEIADFWASINPHFWPDAVMRADMKVHLDQTLAEAVDELQGNFAAGVTEYEAVHLHILNMADMLSNGIMGQFPNRFK
jgi:hypothetical protein